MARAKRHEEHENHERWLVSYADFITLLFAFFVVLYATSSQNVEKEKQFENSIRAEFKMAAVGGQGTSGNANIGGDVFDPIDGFRRKGISNEDLEEAVEKLIAKTMSDKERKQAIAGIRHDAIGVRISLQASNFFPSGSAKLRLPALKSLDKIAKILKAGNQKMIIEGHTDDLSVSGGSYESNWELASIRATSVVRYLVKYHNIDPKRLSAISYADQRPIVPNNSEENRAKNRRIEILIVNSGEE